MDLIQNVDVERLYTHILSLEGIRHPISSPQGLLLAKNYINKELTSYGYNVKEEEFLVEELSDPFSNVIAYNNNPSDPEVLITSHYDTVINTPGADDNASAVAIMLESARILKDQGNFKFISFTLEEGNPAHLQNLLSKGKELGLLTDENRLTSARLVDLSQEIQKKISELLEVGKKNIVAEVLSTFDTNLTDKEMEYFRIRYKIYEDGMRTVLGKFDLMGSTHHVSAIENHENITGVINLETIGYTSPKPNSQNFPTPLDPSMATKHNTQENLSVGDFAFIISHNVSQTLGASFFEQTQLEAINLTSAWLHVPFDYQTIVNTMPDILRSDHAPFWEKNIPALIITDTANFRNPYYHTPADTISTLDFKFIKQICQSTIVCALNMLDSVN